MKQEIQKVHAEAVEKLEEHQYFCKAKICAKCKDLQAAVKKTQKSKYKNKTKSFTLMVSKIHVK